jgi:predicted transcriptional regulator
MAESSVLTLRLDSELKKQLDLLSHATSRSGPSLPPRRFVSILP